MPHLQGGGGLSWPTGPGRPQGGNSNFNRQEFPGDADF